MQKRELYTLDAGTLKRERRFCPRCGPGVFLAEHADRYTCGRCRYTEFKKKTSQEEGQIAAIKPSRAKPVKKKEAKAA